MQKRNKLRSSNKWIPWWRRDIDNLELHQLVEFVDALKTFKERVIEVVQGKESKKCNDKHPNEMEAAQMAQVQPYQPHLWDDEQGAFINTQSVMGSSSLNGSNHASNPPLMLQDGNEWSFLTYGNPSIFNEGMPSHLLMPDEGCLPLSAVMSDLQRV
ncbi:hypothetical protein KI387_014570, partial [Taxus chinensis]